MAKIKIISNPYQQTIKYLRWQDSTEEWVGVNSNSKLLGTDLTKCFFPFKVKDIIDVIKEEYEADDEIITIVFEGTADEYQELINVCETDEYKDSIRVVKGDTYLENARDVLPYIIEIFQKINPLILKNVPDDRKIKKDLKKFSDSSNDTIPICILGNYSSGKSTFINALIGHEILPSGDEPVTARVFRIIRSEKENEAVISFKFLGTLVRLTISDENCKFNVTLTNDLIKELTKTLDEHKEDTLETKVNTALTVINSFDANNEAVSDMITIEVPFISDVLTNPKNDFVIFDTPGSNTASNEKHIKVLEGALEDLSNGLPIFVSEYDSLDSTDNEKLYTKIMEMKQLDERFTMIIVNKADMANLPKNGFTEQSKAQLLAEAVPKNLYSEGIYFVSSIMGLGSKIDGDFNDDYYAEIYDGQRKKYADPSNRFYRSLYRYNILPSQLIKPMIKDAQNCDNLVFANSGLFSVENEIDTFANKYSSYNKAQQSLRFLERVVTFTSREIDRSTQEREDSKDNLIKQLNYEKQVLVKRLRYATNYQISDFKEDYPTDVLSILPSCYPNWEVDYIKSQWEKIQEKHKNDLNYEVYSNNESKARNAIASNLFGGIKKMYETQKENWNGFEDLKEDVVSIGKRFIDDVGFAKENYDANKDLKKHVNLTSSEELLNQVKIDYKNHYYTANRIIEKKSKGFINDRTVVLRNSLDKIVLDSEGLDEQERSELSEIITNYTLPQIEDKVDDLFKMDKLDYAIQIGNFAIGDTTVLVFGKLRDTFNKTMNEDVDELGRTIEEESNLYYAQWANGLLETVEEHLTENNPGLKKKVENIDEESRIIEELRQNNETLQMYLDKISEMLDWKQ